ncbi:unnamed protein product [Paramecium sonneborni]|uniref:SWIRM domain-containing protein n=1 Tax=Paramecium sonneborni TaxID=65129 RepID=A0A8S1QV93_9CILI|nr:unnamed protein product [Paramecium sonneborni]
MFILINPLLHIPDCQDLFYYKLTFYILLFLGMFNRRPESRNSQITILLQKVSTGYEVLEVQTEQRKLIPKPQTQSIPPPIKKENTTTNITQEATQSKKDWFLQNWEAIIPAPARWFQIDSIHQIEKDSLPEFFHQHFHNDISYYKGNYKTPLTYLKIRNAILQKWISTQTKYLKFTDCLNFISGDASSLLRVYTFLEHWGLINFQYNPNNLPNQGQVYQQNGTFLERVKLNFQSNQINFHSDPHYECHICDKRAYPFHQQKKENLASFQLQPLLLCNNCFIDKKYPKFLKNEDFQQFQQTQKYAPWTQDEIYRLLELVYKHKEKWNEIAKYFAKRSLIEIVKMYLQLPYSNIFPSLDKESSIPKKPQKELITFHNDVSNPIQLGVACFKSQLDKLKLPNIEVTQTQEPEKMDENLKQMISVQMEKIEEQLLYLETYEQLINQEKQCVQTIQKKNLQMQVQVQTNNIVSDNMMFL